MKIGEGAVDYAIKICRKIAKGVLSRRLDLFRRIRICYLLRIRICNLLRIRICYLVRDRMGYKVVLRLRGWLRYLYRWHGDGCRRAVSMEKRKWCRGRREVSGVGRLGVVRIRVILRRGCWLRGNCRSTEQGCNRKESG